jgi:hypothetical protein
MDSTQSMFAVSRNLKILNLGTVPVQQKVAIMFRDMLMHWTRLGPKLAGCRTLRTVRGTEGRIQLEK